MAESQPPLRVVAADEFIAFEEPSAAALLGTSAEALLTRDGFLLFYGEAGASKTTLAIDLVAHLASGVSWLGFEVPRPLRVLLIENEGPRGPFRAKLRRKVEEWDGPPFAHNVFIFAEPWGRLNLADQTHRETLAAFAREHEIDVIVCGPLKRLGMTGGGTPDDVRVFSEHLRALQELCGGVALVMTHHENKTGGVSGAWEGEPDTFINVAVDGGGGRTTLHIRKARWAPSWHKKKLVLAWTSGEGFVPIEAETRSRDLRAELLAVRADGTWKREKDWKGLLRCRDLKNLLDALVAEGRWERQKGAPGLRANAIGYRPKPTDLADIPALVQPGPNPPANGPTAPASIGGCRDEGSFEADSFQTTNQGDEAVRDGHLRFSDQSGGDSQ